MLLTTVNQSLLGGLPVPTTCIKVLTCYDFLYIPQTQNYPQNLALERENIHSAFHKGVTRFSPKVSQDFSFLNTL